MAVKFNPLIFSGLDFSGGGSNPNFVSPVADEASLPASPNDGAMCVVKSTDHIYVYDGTTSKWVDTGLTATAFGSTPNANGYSLQVDTSGAVVRNKVVLEPASSSFPGSVSTTTQSFAGDKTFADDVAVFGTMTVTGVTYSNGGLDVTTLGGTLSIGSTNASIVNIGTAGATVNIVGSVNNNNVTNLNVTDALITLNDGGGAGSAAGAGFELEEAGSPTGYVKTSGDRNSFILKAPNTAGIATITPGAGGITLNQSSHDPITLAAVGSSPNANGASLSGQVLNLELADASNPGLVSAASQTFAGAKTFNALVTAGSGLTVTGTTTLDSGLTGPVKAASGVISASAINLTSEVTGVLPIANGGTGSATQNFVDLTTVQSVGGAKSFSALLTASSGLTVVGTTTLSTGLTGPLKASSGIVSASAVSLTSEVTGTLPIANGGTNSATALNNDRIMVSSGGAIIESGQLSDAKFLIGSSGGAPLVGTIVGGVGVVVDYLSPDITLALSVPPSSGDLAETSFTAADNQASPANITGFAFDNGTVRAFEAIVSIVRGSTYAVYRLTGLQKAASWELDQSYLGDITGLTFGITNLGEITYTSTSTGSTAALKFRAQTVSI